MYVRGPRGKHPRTASRWLIAKPYRTLLLFLNVTCFQIRMSSSGICRLTHSHAFPFSNECFINRETSGVNLYGHLHTNTHPSTRNYEIHRELACNGTGHQMELQSSEVIRPRTALFIHVGRTIKSTRQAIKYIRNSEVRLQSPFTRRQCY